VLNSYEKERSQEGSHKGGRKEGNNQPTPFLFLFLYLFLYLYLILVLLS
jgi:hypothetical protein